MAANDALLHNWFYGNLYVRLVFATAFAYLMGSIPFRNVFAWFFAGLDPRLGRTAAGLAPVMNLLKAFVPVLIVAHGGGHVAGALATFGAVLGDCYSPWLRFRRSGRGGAALLGGLAGSCWPAALAFGAAWLAVAVASNYASVGTVFATIAALAPLWFFNGSPGALIAIAAIVLIASAHRDAFVRLRDGCEPTMRPERVARSLPAPDSVVRLSGQPVQC